MPIHMQPARSALSSNDNEMNKTMKYTNVKGQSVPGLFHMIARGLGARILWTVPGVTLTTAGFEALRALAVGSD